MLAWRRPATRCPVPEASESKRFVLERGSTTPRKRAVTLALTFALVASAACQDDLDLDTTSYKCAEKEHCAPGYVCDQRDCECKSESDGDPPPHLEPVPGTDCEVIRHYKRWIDYGPADPGPADP